MIIDRPPPDWKRPSMPIRVKLDVVIRQSGLCKQTGDKLGTLENTRFDHRPALWERKFDSVARDTVPPANDAAHIEAVTIKGHDIRTHGPGGEKRITTLGSDSHRRAKGDRLAEKRVAHEAALASKGSGDEPDLSEKPCKRPWVKGRKLQSRNTFEKRQMSDQPAQDA